ncbi:MAG: WD40-repeat-containing domain protein, partial [Piptocephalis tieghemiana]
IPDEDASIRSLAISPDCTTLVAGSQSSDVFVWHLPSQTEMGKPVPVHRFVAHEHAYLTRLAVAQDQSTGSMLLSTCASDASVRLWDLGRANCPRKSELRGHKRWVWDCAFSADSAYLVTASSDCTARLWELSSGETVRHYNGHNKAAVCIALNDLSVT